MTHARISRRDAARRLLLSSTALALPTWLVGCKKELACTDTSGLTPDEANARTQVMAYVDRSMDASKTCGGCQLFKPAGEGQCGACQVVKGPINPLGNCKSWVKKPA
jgi:hypothetical protein